MLARDHRRHLHVVTRTRWTKYWLRQDWRRLLSRLQGDPLTVEVQQRIIDCWIQFPWWSARRYLAVFEKVYRFIPFSNDARPSIRGRSPLDLAGYEVAKLPMAELCRAWALQWPNTAFEELVPDV